eukprot:3374631-Pyramimonas_sp.AAC.1
MLDRGSLGEIESSAPQLRTPLARARTLAGSVKTDGAQASAARRSLGTLATKNAGTLGSGR